MPPPLFSVPAKRMIWRKFIPEFVKLIKYVSLLEGRMRMLERLLAEKVILTDDDIARLDDQACSLDDQTDEPEHDGMSLEPSETTDLVQPLERLESELDPCSTPTTLPALTASSAVSVSSAQCMKTPVAAVKRKSKARKKVQNTNAKRRRKAALDVADPGAGESTDVHSEYFQTFRTPVRKRSVSVASQKKPKPQFDTRMKGSLLFITENDRDLRIRLPHLNDDEIRHKLRKMYRRLPSAVRSSYKDRCERFNNIF